MDLISRQAAIDALRSCQTYLFDAKDPDKKIELRSAELVIEGLPPVQPESHWIPCSERLPEERGFYLTTTKDKAVYCDHWNEDNFDRTEMVIAWMPLPEPYRGGDSE